MYMDMTELLTRKPESLRGEVAALTAAAETALELYKGTGDIEIRDGELSIRAAVNGTSLLIETIGTDGIRHFKLDTMHSYDPESGQWDPICVSDAWEDGGDYVKRKIKEPRKKGEHARRLNPPEWKIKEYNERIPVGAGTLDVLEHKFGEPPADKLPEPDRAAGLRKALAAFARRHT